jgi:hypothetical protein
MPEECKRFSVSQGSSPVTPTQAKFNTLDQKDTEKPR